MGDFFLMNNTWRILVKALKYRWKLRRSTGPVAKRRTAVNDPNEMARHIKQKAKELGAGIVGITEIQPNDLYEDIELKHRCAICIEVCPWSEPDRGPKLSQMLLAKREKTRIEYTIFRAHN